MVHFYSDDGAKLYDMGVEGETFEMEDGEAVYMDLILDPEGDMTFEQAVVQQLTWVGSINGIIKADYFQGGESAPQSMDAAEKKIGRASCRERRYVDAGEEAIT